MAEPTIIQEQRDVVRAVRALADEHVQEELEAENRLRLDREAADQALAQAREAADAELRRAFEMLQEADRLVQPRSDKATAPRSSRSRRPSCSIPTCSWGCGSRRPRWRPA